MPDLSPEALWDHYRAAVVLFASRLAVSLLLFAVFWLAAAALRRLVARGIRARHVDPDMVLLLAGSARWALILVGAVTALGTLGVDVTALVAGLGLAGFALGFALKDMVSNALSGVLILIYRPFRRGDLVTVDPNQGVVAEINLRYTVLHTEEQRILIPNATLFTNVVKVSTKAPTLPAAEPAAPAAHVESSPPDAAPPGTAGP